MMQQLLGLGVSVMACQVLGALYYSPYLMGRLWMRHQFPGRKAVGAGKGAFVASLLSCASLAIVVQLALQTCFKGVTDVLLGAQIGLGLSALVALALIPHLMFGQNSFVVFIIDRIYDALVLTTMVTCLVYF